MKIRITAGDIVDPDGDIVVTLPRGRLREWIDEGDAAGDPPAGGSWAFHMGGKPPKKTKPGNRVYVVYDGHLIGYAPLIRIDSDVQGTGFNLVREGDAQAVTIDQHVPGFRGFRYRWWDREEERPFPDWKKLASVEYPLAGSTVSGLAVGSNIDNTSSIAASLDEYTVLPGIREVPMAGLRSAPSDLFYAADDHVRVEQLAEAIRASGRIDPLIVVVDAEGPYILEGAHRLGALHLLGVQSFPALVVRDDENQSQPTTPEPIQAFRGKIVITSDMVNELEQLSDTLNNELQQQQQQVQQPVRAGWAGAYPWGSGRVADDGSHPHTDGAIPGKAPPANEQVTWQGGDFYRDIANQWGQVTPGKSTNLRHYDYLPYAQAIDDLARQYGYDVYMAGGQYGAPDLANKNYNTGHLMIYDPSPGSGGEFGDEQYTKAWRTIHELAHALAYDEVNQKWGERRRLGKLGWQRSLNDAKRAVEWEWLAAHKQRELGAELGYQVDDATFNRELNTVLHDAVHRAITGQFTNPDQEGFEPSDQPISLEVAFQQLEAAAQRLGLTDPDAVLTPEQKQQLKQQRRSAASVEARNFSHELREIADNEGGRLAALDDALPLPSKGGRGKTGGPCATAADATQAPSRILADLVPGGAGDDVPDRDFDPDELETGVEDELEHTNDPAVAREIAKDHLTNDPHYYSKNAAGEIYGSAPTPAEVRAWSPDLKRLTVYNSDDPIWMLPASAGPAPTPEIAATATRAFENYADAYRAAVPPTPADRSQQRDDGITFEERDEDGAVNLAMIMDGAPIAEALIEFGTLQELYGSRVYPHVDDTEYSDEDDLDAGATPTLKNGADPAAYVYETEIDPRHRGKGFGRILFEQIFEVAKQRGAKWFVGYATDIGGGDPRGFYEAMDFEFIDERPYGSTVLKRIALIASVDLAALVEEFLACAGQSFAACRTVGGAHAQCDVASQALHEFLSDRGISSKVIAVRGPVEPPRSGRWRNKPTEHLQHDAVQVGDMIVDLTARQFDAGAPFPLIEPAASYLAKWQHSRTGLLDHWKYQDPGIYIAERSINHRGPCEKVHPDKTHDEWWETEGKAFLREAEDEPAKQRATWRGLDVVLEQLGGDTRHPEGPYPTFIPESWVGYGYFEGLEADDGDSLDVIVGPSEFGEVYLAIQKDKETGEFVQFKVMLGFESEAAAAAGYRMLWPVEMYGGITTIPIEEFRNTVMPKLVVDDGLDPILAAVQSDLVDAVQYLNDSYDRFDPPITVQDLQLVESGRMRPNELPWMDPAYPGEHAEDRAEAPHIQNQFAQGNVNPVIIIEGEDFEVLADGYGRASYAAVHGLDVPFERYRISRAVSRNAMPMRDPSYMPEGWKVRVEEDADHIFIRLVSDKGYGKPIGEVWVDKANGEVAKSAAEQGWGPLLYEVAMEILTERGVPMSSDWISVSDDALGVWNKFYEREDIAREPRPKPHHKRIEEPLQYQYTKQRQRLDELRDRNQLDVKPYRPRQAAQIDVPQGEFHDWSSVLIDALIERGGYDPDPQRGANELIKIIRRGEDPRFIDASVRVFTGPMITRVQGWVTTQRNAVVFDEYVDPEEHSNDFDAYLAAVLAAGQQAENSVRAALGRTADKTIALFVYGTLRKGQPKHHLIKDALFLKETRAKGKIIDDAELGKALVDGDDWVKGELYAIGMNKMPEIDAFEAPEFKRKKVYLEDGKEAWAYFLLESHRAALDASTMMAQARRLAMMISAGRKEQVLQRYPHLTPYIEEIAAADPSGSQKYLAWAAQQLDREHSALLAQFGPNGRSSLGESVDDMMRHHVGRLTEWLGRFHAVQPRLKQRDVNQYKTWQDLADAAGQGERTQTSRQIRDEAKQGAEKIFEDQAAQVLKIDTHGAACVYGKGTKWCITERDVGNWENYSSQGVRFYFVIPKQGVDRDGLMQLAFEIGQAIEQHYPDYSRLQNELDALGAAFQAADPQAIETARTALMQAVMAHGAEMDLDPSLDVPDDKLFPWEVEVQLDKLFARVPHHFLSPEQKWAIAAHPDGSVEYYNAVDKKVDRKLIPAPLQPAIDAALADAGHTIRRSKIRVTATDLEEILEHIRSSNPHVGLPQDAMPAERWAAFDWMGPVDIDPNDPRIERGDRQLASGPLVAQYATQMLAGSEPPAVLLTVYADGNWGVSDGAHRLQAAREAGLESIKAYIGTRKPRAAQRLRKRLPPKKKLWDMLIAESAIAYPPDFVNADARYLRWKQSYAANRPGPKPIWTGGETDAINGYLSLEGPRKVSGPYEGFELLTRNMTSWDELANSDVLRVLNEVPGLEQLRLPEGAYERQLDQELELYYQQQAPQEEELDTSFDVEELSRTGKIRVTAADLDDPLIETASWLAGATPVDVGEVKQHLRLWSGGGVLIDRDYEQGRWFRLDVPVGMLPRGRPWSPEQATEYAELDPAGSPELVLEAVPRERDGAVEGWTLRIVDGEHRTYAARARGQQSVPAFVGFPDFVRRWSRQAYLREGKVPGEKAVVVLRVPRALARMWPEEITEKNGPPHFTISYIPGPHDEGARIRLLQLVKKTAEGTPPIPVELAKGVAWFTTDNPKEENKEIAHKDVHPKTAERMAELHWTLIEGLEQLGFKPARRDDFKAHSTLEYCPTREYSGPVPEGGWTADAIEVWGWEETYTFRLEGTPERRAAGKKQKKRRRRRFSGEVYYAAPGSWLLRTKQEDGDEEVKLEAGARILREGCTEWKKDDSLDDRIEAALEHGYDAVRDGDRLVVLNRDVVSDRVEAKRKNWLGSNA